MSHAYKIGDHVVIEIRHGANKSGPVPKSLLSGIVIRREKSGALRVRVGDKDYYVQQRNVVG